MFAPTNPEQERIRAEAVLRSFTDYREAVDMFARKCDQGETDESAVEAERGQRRSLLEVLQAIRLNRRPVLDESLQPLAPAPRPATNSGCSR